MADKHHHADNNAADGGSMDISEHVKMWHAFWNVCVYSSAALAVLALLLLLFRTNDAGV